MQLQHYSLIIKCFSYFAADIHGIWDSLVFDGHIKSQLLHYATTTLLFSDHQVNPNIIAWNKVVLLHGKYYLHTRALYKPLKSDAPHFVYTFA